jgi:hypothetical protein
MIYGGPRKGEITRIYRIRKMTFIPRAGKQRFWRKRKVKATASSEAREEPLATNREFTNDF